MSKKMKAQITPTAGFIKVGEGFDQVSCCFDLVDDNYLLTDIDGTLDVEELTAVSEKLQELQNAYDGKSK